MKKQQFRKASMSQEDWNTHNNSVKCWICLEDFNNNEIMSAKGNPYKPKGKVIDHDHLTGKYIGAAHSDCNFN